MRRFGTTVMAFALGLSITLTSSAFAAPSQWSASNSYPAGSQVEYNGSTYEARWWTQNETPGSNEWGAWKKVSGSTGDNRGDVNPGGSTGSGEISDQIPNWDASTIYTDGDQVIYNNTIYEAKWWVRGEAPDKSSAWKEIVPAGSVDPVEPVDPVDPVTPVEPTEPEVNEAPILTGVQPKVTLTAGDTFDPLKGVTATDKEDGDLTASIVVVGTVDTTKAGVKPDSGVPWVLIGDAEWTVKEDEKNYQKDENTESNSINKILTDKEIDTLYGGINPNYSSEAALGRLEELIPKSAYEELFPYRFGSENWKNCPATKLYYPNADSMPDYYSYENLQEALHTLANTIIKVQWYEGAEWCYRIIRLDKTTKEQKLVYSDPSFGEDWLTTSKELCTSICDYGSFLAEGDLNTRKRELAGFLANISHETGGGTIDGLVDESLSGLYFNEEVGFIGSSAIGYVQASGTSYLPVAGKSYHGRGPIQLSYNYNYGLCSDVLYGDSSILLNDPDKLEEDGVLGFMTGIWFWMTPQPPKPSCHQVITGVWEPKAGAPNEKFNGNFGLTIIIINNEAGQSETGAGAVARRAKYYRIFAAKMGADITGEHCDTVGMTTFVQQAAAQ